MNFLYAQLFQAPFGVYGGQNSDAQNSFFFFFKVKKIDLSFFVSFILVLISCCFLFKGRTGFLVVQSEKNMYQKLQ